MATCPNCGHDTNEARKLVKASARDLVEALTVHDVVDDVKSVAPGWKCDAAYDELQAFKDRMRANGYRTNAGPVRDARAAFRTHLRNAVRFSRRDKPQPERTAPTPRKEL